MSIALFFVPLCHENEDVINIISVIVAALPGWLQNGEVCACARVPHLVQDEGGHGAAVGQRILS